MASAGSASPWRHAQVVVRPVVERPSRHLRWSLPLCPMLQRAASPVAADPTRSTLRYGGMVCVDVFFVRPDFLIAGPTPARSAGRTPPVPAAPHQRHLRSGKADVLWAATGISVQDPRATGMGDTLLGPADVPVSRGVSPGTAPNVLPRILP